MRQALYVAAPIDYPPGDVASVTIPSNAYTSALFPPINPPLPLNLIFTRDKVSSASVIYTLDFANTTTEIVFVILIDYSVSPPSVEVSSLDAGVSVAVDLGTTPSPTSASIITVTFMNRIDSIFPVGSYNEGDTYSIALNSFLAVNGVAVSFLRFLQTINNRQVSSTGPTGFISSLQSLAQGPVGITPAFNNHVISNPFSNLITLDNGLIRIPNVNFNGQTTTLYGYELSDFTFTVQDDRCYKDGKHAEIGCHKM